MYGRVEAVATVVPALTAFHAENSTYADATLTVLREQYDLQIDDCPASHYRISSLNSNSYCLENHVGDWYAWTTGPGSPIKADNTSHC